MGELYNALYGTDVISGSVNTIWDRERAKKVISFVKDFFDERFPLEGNVWKEISNLQVEKNKLVLYSGLNKYYLKNNDQFIGYNGEKNKQIRF